MIFLVVLYEIIYFSGEYFSDLIGVSHIFSAIGLAIFTAVCFIIFKRNNPHQKSDKPSGKCVVFLLMLIFPAVNLVYLFFNGATLSFNAFGTVLMLVGAVAEEYAFRGYLFKKLKEIFIDKPMLCAMINGILFGLFHLLNLLNGSGQMPWDQVMLSAAVGFCLCGAAEYFCSIVPAVIIHLLINLTGSMIEISKNGIFYITINILLSVLGIVLGVWMTKIRSNKT